MKLEQVVLQQQSFFEQFCSQFDWYDFKILSCFLTRLPFPNDTTTQSLHSIYQLFRRRGITISRMTVSRRLNRIALLGLLRKLPKTNPVFYEIARGQEELIRKIVYFKHTEESFGLVEMAHRDEKYM